MGCRYGIPQPGEHEHGKLKIFSWIEIQFRHPLDVIVSTTKCILGLTGRLWSAVFEIFQYIACKIWGQ